MAPLTVQNKDPDFDYSFRRRKDVEDNGGEDLDGYSPVTEGNSSGEAFSMYPGQKKTRGSKSAFYADTVLCRRPKHISRYFKRIEDEQYNSQVNHVRNAAKRARDAFRDLDPDSVVEAKTEFRGPGMKQRAGVTEEGD